MKIRFQRRWWVVAAVAIVVTGLVTFAQWRPDPSGTLAINIAAPAVTTAVSVTVSGPDEFTTTIFDTTTLTGLAPGTYTISNSSSPDTVDALPDSQTVNVDNEKTTEASIFLFPSSVVKPGEYQGAFVVNGEPQTAMRWNPCEPVTWAYATDSAISPVFDRSMRQAFDQVTSVTGIAFVKTSSNPDITVTVGSTSGQAVSGEGRYVYALNPASDHSGQITSGTIDAQIGDRAQERYVHALLLHELGHVVGLDHVDDPTQAMYPDVHASELMAGDKAGLAYLGARQGCLNLAPSTDAVP